MTHRWKVSQDGNELGEVEALTKKGAEHEAYETFHIEFHRRHTVSVTKIEETVDG